MPQRDRDGCNRPSCRPGVEQGAGRSAVATVLRVSAARSIGLVIARGSPERTHSVGFHEEYHRAGPRYTRRAGVEALSESRAARRPKSALDHEREERRGLAPRDQAHVVEAMPVRIGWPSPPARMRAPEGRGADIEDGRGLHACEDRRRRQRSSTSTVAPRATAPARRRFREATTGCRAKPDTVFRRSGGRCTGKSAATAGAVPIREDGDMNTRRASDGMVWTTPAHREDSPPPRRRAPRRRDSEGNRDQDGGRERGQGQAGITT